MTLGEILRIVAFVLQLVAQGMGESEAVTLASAKFGVSASEIWRHL